MPDPLNPSANPLDLAPTPIIDSDHPDIIDFTFSRSADSNGALSKVIAVYYAVRDELRYDPYTIDMTEDGLKASNTLNSGRGWCVTKAALLAACCRALGVPAKVGFADVRNHLSTENLRQSMGTDIFYWHGYTSIYLDSKWVKATPAFNIELCEKFRIKSLEFDGTEDSIYHPFDEDGRQHMEYVNMRGEHTDVPMEEMIADFRHYYPNLSLKQSGNDFDREVDM
ncbi:MAG: transglutaminase family protein [Pseudomonadota bacterium]